MIRCRAQHPLDHGQCELPTGHAEMHQYSLSQVDEAEVSRYWERGKGVRGMLAESTCTPGSGARITQMSFTA